MTPPRVRVHCRDCHRDSNPDDIAVVTSIIHDHAGFTAIDQWRATCRHCGHINLNDCTEHTANLLEAAGAPRHWIDPHKEVQPDLGPLTINDVIDTARAIHAADNDAMWDELDRDLDGTDSGWIDWGDQ